MDKMISQWFSHVLSTKILLDPMTLLSLWDTSSVLEKWMSNFSVTFRTNDRSTTIPSWNDRLVKKPEIPCQIRHMRLILAQHLWNITFWFLFAIFINKSKSPPREIPSFSLRGNSFSVDINQRWFYISEIFGHIWR